MLETKDIFEDICKKENLPKLEFEKIELEIKNLETEIRVGYAMHLKYNLFTSKKQAKIGLLIYKVCACCREIFKPGLSRKECDKCYEEIHSD